MFWQFCKYFFSYIFKVKTRQKLLFLAIVGLFISSFSLIVLQSTMGGLQNNIITRSKNILGSATIYLRDGKLSLANDIKEFITKKYETDSYIEYEIELLLRSGAYLSPVIVHGIESKNKIANFLKDVRVDDIVISSYLADKLRIYFGDNVNLISPSHVNSLLGDVPRAVSANVSEIITTDVPEVDISHVWVRLPIVQNLIRKKVANRIRIYGEIDFNDLKNKINKLFGENAYVKTWEDENQTLVWSLKLETTVMTFLFITMTLLVSLCITSGLLIFFDKIRHDLASFWILGVSKRNLEKSALLFLNFISLFSVLAGLVIGLVFLFLLDRYGANILPSDIFIDSKLPVFVTLKGIIVSFSVPYFISIIFSYFSVANFKKESSYLENVRSVGA